MRVLVACEESQTLCLALRNLGVEAYSCDLKECSGGHPEWHILGDVISHLKSVPPFFYDMIVSHPPCTYLSACQGFRFYNKDGSLNSDRLDKLSAAREFFMFFFNYPYCKHIAIENPRVLKRAGLPKHSQVIQPYDFGDPYSKQTLLWLRGLPPLVPTVNVLNRRSAAPSWVALNHSSETRSKSFPGIASQMALQWSHYVSISFT